MAKKSKGIKAVANKLAGALETAANVPGLVKSTPAYDDNKWKAQDALRDIQRAEKHKSDPKLMKEVKALAKQDLAALKKVCK